uniref:OBP4 n=1 Tax=Trichogramma japonicum TaxID=311206 RepID=A0A2K5B190_9HYME|nr:OBP4 [Trichogramma japonicum]
MSRFALFLALFAMVVLASGHNIEKMKEAFKSCKTDVGVAEDTPMKDIPSSKMGCFHACVMKKFDTMKDGKIMVENLLERAEKRMNPLPAEMKEKLAKCADDANGKGDECEVAGYMHDCWWDLMKSMGVTPKGSSN